MNIKHYVMAKRADMKGCEDVCIGVYDDFKTASTVLIQCHEGKTEYGKFKRFSYFYMLTTNDTLSDNDIVKTNFKFIQEK